MSGTNYLALGQPPMQSGNLLAAAAPVADPYDFTARYNTSLSAADEAKFQAWAAKSGKLGDLYDYDMRGFWKSGGKFDDETGHAGDTFKKPNHPTFSTYSQYHGADGYEGGQWAGGENGQPFAFTPSATNLKMMSLPALQDYFASPAEAGRSVLVMPNGNGQ